MSILLCLIWGSIIVLPNTAKAWTHMPLPLQWQRTKVSTPSALKFFLQDDEATTTDGWNNSNISQRNSTIDGLPPAVLGRNNFGDIMSPTVDDADVLFRDGLVTSSTYSLAQMYGIHHPLDRMAVTANGNLQRLFSSYYDAPVTVVVDHCTPIGESTWDRRVQLQVYGQTFCVADSQVQVHSAHCQQLVESGQVGLGQLFRHLNMLPDFALQKAGPTEEGGFWRHYTLTCTEVSCAITEQFCPGVWELKPHMDSQGKSDNQSD